MIEGLQGTPRILSFAISITSTLSDFPAENVKSTENEKNQIIPWDAILCFMHISPVKTVSWLTLKIP